MEAGAPLAFVAIGRNEGERLQRCLRSLTAVSRRIVYVDSGSTDGSVEFARGLGCQVVELDMSLPFSMARGRNAGWRQAVELWPDTQFIHFIDGDCELLADWVPAALAFLGGHERVAVVCGRRRERHPQRSLFNRLCESEWNTPLGETRACGGDAIMRLSALSACGGFDECLIAGEEPELCLRLRNSGWRIHRIDHDMTLHDADITAWRQWWRRCKRGGYGAYDVMRRTAKLPGGPLFATAVRSAVRWMTGSLAALLVALAVGVFLSWPLAGVVALAVPGLWSLQALRIAMRARGRCDGWREAAEYGVCTMLAKIPQCLGILQSRRDHAASRQAEIIEYKS